MFIRKSISGFEFLYRKSIFIIWLWLVNLTLSCWLMGNEFFKWSSLKLCISDNIDKK